MHWPEAQAYHTRARVRTRADLTHAHAHTQRARTSTLSGVSSFVGSATGTIREPRVMVWAGEEYPTTRFLCSDDRACEFALVVKWLMMYSQTSNIKLLDESPSEQSQIRNRT